MIAASLALDRDPTGIVDVGDAVVRPRHSRTSFRFSWLHHFSGWDTFSGFRVLQSGARVLPVNAPIA